MAEVEPRALFVFSRASQGGCCCYGGCHAESHVFATAQEAKIALRASLHEGVWFHLTDSEVYDMCYIGARGSKTKTIAALRAGASVEESFDFDAVNVSGDRMNPDSWEECSAGTRRETTGPSQSPRCPGKRTAIMGASPESTFSV